MTFIMITHGIWNKSPIRIDIEPARSDYDHVFVAFACRADRRRFLSRSDAGSRWRAAIKAPKSPTK